LGGGKKSENFCRQRIREGNKKGEKFLTEAGKGKGLISKPEQKKKSINKREGSDDAGAEASK